MRSWYHAYDVAARAGVVAVVACLPLLAAARLPSLTSLMPPEVQVAPESDGEWSALPEWNPRPTSLVVAPAESVPAEVEPVAPPRPEAVNGTAPPASKGTPKGAGSSKPKGQYVTSAKTTGKRGAGGCVDEAKPGILRESAGRFVVERSFLRKYTGNLDAASRLAAVERHKGNGANGYRLTKVKTCGALYQMGLRNGDVLESVNGHQVRDVMSAYKALKILKREDDITIAVHRKGRPVKIRYTVV